MNSITVGDVTLQYEDTFINEEILLLGTKRIVVPDVPWDYPFWIHPQFLASCQESGIPMETDGDLAAFFEMFEDEKSHVKDYTKERFRNTAVNTMRYHDSNADYDAMSIDLRSWEPRDPEAKLYSLRASNSTSFNAVSDRLSKALKLTVQRVFEYNSYRTIRYSERTGCEQDRYPHWYYRVHNWSWEPPEQVFLATKRDARSSMFFGMELEVSTSLSVAEIQAIVTEFEPKQEPFFFFKDDTSISGRFDNLVEIVTHPMTPRRARIEWRKFFTKMEKVAYFMETTVDELFDTSTNLNNGLHIHLSNDGFDSIGHMRRFQTAWNFWDRAAQEFYKNVGKRQFIPDSSNYYHIHPDLAGRTLAFRLKNGVARSSRHDNQRRHAVCHQNPMTTELRIFQGIFDKRHVLACIEVTLASLEFTRQCPLSKYNRHFISRFKDWTMNQQGYKYAKEVLACA